VRVSDTVKAAAKTRRPQSGSAVESGFIARILTSVRASHPEHANSAQRPVLAAAIGAQKEPDPPGVTRRRPGMARAVRHALLSLVAVIDAMVYTMLQDSGRLKDVSGLLPKRPPTFSDVRGSFGTSGDVSGHPGDRLREPWSS
jgi:hypothetical protein